MQANRSNCRRNNYNPLFLVAVTVAAERNLAIRERDIRRLHRFWIKNWRVFIDLSNQGLTAATRLSYSVQSADFSCSLMS